MFLCVLKFNRSSLYGRKCDTKFVFNHFLQLCVSNNICVLILQTLFLLMQRVRDVIFYFTWNRLRYVWQILNLP